MNPLNALNAILKDNKFPLLSEEQGNSLFMTTQGKQLSSILEASGRLPLDQIECMVRAVSPTAINGLHKAGFVYQTQEIMDVALSEKKNLFAALHAVVSNSSQASASKSYLDLLGFKKISSPPPNLASAPPYYSFHVYAKKGAICFSEAQSRKKVYTINVEAATAVESGASTQYDWSNKIVLQLSSNELFLIMAMLNGKLPQLSFTGHGTLHDKVMELSIQSTNYFLRIMQRGRSAVSVPMQPADALNLTALLYKQIKLNFPHLGKDEIASMESQLVRMHGRGS